MASTYLADTTLLIDSLRGSTTAKTFLAKHSPPISVVSAAELIQGCNSKKDLAATQKLCSQFETYPLSSDVSSLAINLMEKYYLSHHLEFADSLIAATTINLDLTLVTSNTKHFSFISNLKLLLWQKLQKSLLPS